MQDEDPEIHTYRGLEVWMSDHSHRKDVSTEQAMDEVKEEINHQKKKREKMDRIKREEEEGGGGVGGEPEKKKRAYKRPGSSSAAAVKKEEKPTAATMIPTAQEIQAEEAFFAQDMFMEEDERKPFGLAPQDYAMFRELMDGDSYREQAYRDVARELVKRHLLKIHPKNAPEGATLNYPDVPTLDWKYLEFFRREAVIQRGERRCRYGKKCICMLSSKFHPDGVEECQSSDSFIGVELLMPEELQAFRLHQRLPEFRWPCLACEIFYTTYRLRSYLKRSWEPHEMLERFHVKVDNEGEYPKEACLPISTMNGRRTGIVGYFPRFNFSHYVFMTRPNPFRRDIAAAAAAEGEPTMEDESLMKTLGPRELHSYQEIFPNFC